MKRILTLLVVVLLPYLLMAQSARKEIQLAEGWRFSLESEQMKADGIKVAAEGYDDALWEVVSVPHDWAIKGPLDENIDKQVKMVVEDGETKPQLRTGRTGALPFVGEGWYRVKFFVPESCERAILTFGGVFGEPVVYVNGHKAGEWKHPYNAFNVDVTPYIYRDGRANTLAVYAVMRQFSSRWYPGGGIFRPVYLTTTSVTAIDCWGLNMTTLSLNDNGDVTASFEAQTTGYEGKKLVARWSVAGKEFEQAVDGNGKAFTAHTFTGITPWSPEEPKLYDMKVELLSVDVDGSRRVVDSKIEKIGFRTIKFTPEKGFELNGKTRKFKGVCMHHDLGMLGAAENMSAIRRQLELLKSMGCDAIRTSHNMPSKWQMDLCDELGFMVMAESFDEWRIAKVQNGYNRFFDEWYKRDLANLVNNHKLHPSIVMWSAGNEVRELWYRPKDKSNNEGASIARMLVGEFHRLDPSRPVTIGMNKPLLDIELGAAQIFDIFGINYHTHQYDDAYAKSGHGLILGAETASTVSSRGEYHFPVKELKKQQDIEHANAHSSSYDTESCPWANLPDYDWVQQEKPWVIGEFVWTGFDYLGEPSPYNEVWPSRSSYFGILDLAGLPKDRYYLYRSRWNTKQPTIHLLPHWNWEGREGEVTPVYCYTNYPTAELFVNGKSQGKRTKRTDGEVLDRYRLRWNEVKYEPGEIKVVVYDANGLKVGEKSVRTAGKPHHIELCANRGTGEKERSYADMYNSCNPSQFSLGGYLKADGEDMSFVAVRVVDKDGNLCPKASHQLVMKVEGQGKFKGVCNGDQTSLEVFTNPTMKLFNGELVVGVQTTKQPGDIVLKVSGKGVGSALITLKSK
jgi:beta-galactosidase